MNYNHPNKNSSTVAIRLMCAIVFLSFSFVWLYCFQADVLAAAQHVLSKGLTTYKPFVGAVLITLVLQALELIVYALTRLRKRSHALNYLPSMLGLAVITDINSNFDGHFTLGSWWWILPLFIGLWLLLVFLARALQSIEPDAEPKGLFSRAMWINMLTMALLIIIVVAFSNSNAVFHYRMRAESRLLSGDFNGALQTGAKSLESDADLQMIRMYALSRTGELGERLFAYPVSGHSEAMLPVEGKSEFVMYPNDSLYKFLGARPKGEMTTARYLELMQRRDSTVNRPVADYQLCGLLIDKRIDDFVCLLRRYYSEGDTLDVDRLPKHYREAMTLYNHLRSKPVVVYHNSVMDEDWKNLQELEAQYPDLTERKGRVEEHYRGTYWYYYEYE
ncbi:MAG: hypothetical protein J5658_12820 [Prevotella sp.]|nr:hypothetical protein [Prevotella sp.]